LIDDGKSFGLGFAFANGSTNLGQSPKKTYRRGDLLLTFQVQTGRIQMSGRIICSLPGPPDLNSP
jgi:hypothetical protein